MQSRRYMNNLFYGYGSNIISAPVAPFISAKRHLLSEDVVKLQEFQQRKQAVAHQVSGSKSHYLEVFNRKLKKNELILKDGLKLLLHLCQSAEDMVIARGAIYRYGSHIMVLYYLRVCLCVLHVRSTDQGPRK
uniref:Uncharacterized protein n=1 Tax=Oncorhynchus kisutch TaxID=8019 RepID=A0A8C7MN53_ONCKI